MHKDTSFLSKNKTLLRYDDLTRHSQLRNVERGGRRVCNLLIGKNYGRVASEELRSISCCVLIWWGGRGGYIFAVGEGKIGFRIR